MVGMNKIEFARKSQKKCFFIFKFHDGLFYWKYSKKREEEFRVAIGGRCDRGRAEYKDYAYILTSCLKKIYL